MKAMENKILGLHHITAIANEAQRNLDFYTKTLGQRLVKKTVNFDDPGTYHFYFGDEKGTPGTVLTFFPWEGIGQGKNGAGMATEIGYSVPPNSLEFWKNRLAEHHITHDEEVAERFGEKLLHLEDPDGLRLALIEPLAPDNRQSWETNEIKEDVATRGFHSTTLTLRRLDPTAKVLTDILGYSLQKQEGNRYRFATEAIPTANFIDVEILEDGHPGRNAAGTNHHIAFRVENDEVLMHYHDLVEQAGLSITPKIDRDYFYSLYFREPGGVLFEIATDNPGFTRDEPLAELGSALKLPRQYENHRSRIEQVLPVLY